MGKARHCSACGRANEADARFCSGCGSPLGVEAPQREARKVLTALFADVVGSTALGERLDPEDLQAVIGDGVARIVRAAEGLGGQVDRIAGDGALIIFGAPVAHEDDPERAVLAGLRILDEIGNYAAKVKAERGIEGFAVRVGIETGLAVLAPVGERAIDFGVMGDVLNTAARLEASAQPGTMLVGPHTHELVEPGFEWDQPIELRLKGKEGVVVARQPLSARAAGAGRPAPARESPLVGRDRELEVLEGAGAELLSGRGGVVIVSGEPGLGKTRLLLELRRRIASDQGARGGALWLEGRCASYGEDLPYFPFRRLLRDWLNAASNADEREVEVLLAERSASLFSARGEQVSPFLATALGLPSHAGDSEEGEQLQPDDMQMRAFAAVEELFVLLSRMGPLAVAFEDLQWSDPTSLKLCERLVPLAGRLPILLLFTMRPEQDHAAAGLRERIATQLGQDSTLLELGPLEEAADRELLATLIRGGALPPELESRVLERAEGNPLYIEELVRSLLDTGVLVREFGGWRFAPEVDAQVPETVEKLILARVDRLSPEGRDLLCAAAVLGRRFSSPVLEALTGDASALVELQEADLVRPERQSPELEFRFKHHLIQEATYGSLLKRRRQELHRQAAEALTRDSRRRGDARLGLLAHHWAAAGEYDCALDYHRRAGQAASRIGSTSEAISHYDGALTACAKLELGPENARTRRLMVERGRMMIFAGRVSEGIDDLVGALAGARGAGDRELELESLTMLAWIRHGGYRHAIGLGEEALEIARADGDERGQVRALARLAILDANQLRLDRALEQGSEALEIARRVSDEEVLCWALDGIKLAQLKLGDLEAVEEHCAELIRISRRRDDLYSVQWALLESVYPALGSGRFEQALARSDEALALNRKLGDRGDEPLFLDARCWVQRSRGRYGPALDAARQATVAAEDANPEWYAWAAATLGWVLLDLRAAEEAIPLLELGRAAAGEAEAAGELLRCDALRARALWLCGRPKDAMLAAEDAEEQLRDVTTPAGGSWLFGAHAQLALARTLTEGGEPERARRIASPLRTAASEAGWLEAEAGAAVTLAHCAVADDRPEDAIPLLTEAARAPGASAVTWEAHLELARLKVDYAERHRAEAGDLLERVRDEIDGDPAAVPFEAAYFPIEHDRSP